MHIPKKGHFLSLSKYNFADILYIAMLSFIFKSFMSLQSSINEVINILGNLQPQTNRNSSLFDLFLAFLSFCLPICSLSSPSLTAN